MRIWMDARVALIDHGALITYVSYLDKSRQMTYIARVRDGIVIRDQTV